MEKKKAYLFLRIPDRGTSKQTIRRIVSEMDRFVSLDYEVVKTIVKIGHSRFINDACDPSLIEDIKAEHPDALIVRSFNALTSDVIELKKFYKALDAEGIELISISDNLEISSYLQIKGTYHRVGTY